MVERTNAYALIAYAPAFPVPVAGIDSATGMTYRQWLLGMVAAGLLPAMYGAEDAQEPEEFEEFAQRCGKYVDALIAEYEKRGG